MADRRRLLDEGPNVINKTVRNAVSSIYAKLHASGGNCEGADAG